MNIMPIPHYLCIYGSCLSQFSGFFLSIRHPVEVSLVLSFYLFLIPFACSNAEHVVIAACNVVIIRSETDSFR